MKAKLTLLCFWKEWRFVGHWYTCIIIYLNGQVEMQYLDLKCRLVTIGNRYWLQFQAIYFKVLSFSLYKNFYIIFQNLSKYVVFRKIIKNIIFISEMIKHYWLDIVIKHIKNIYASWNMKKSSTIFRRKNRPGKNYSAWEHLGIQYTYVYLQWIR